MAEKIRVAIACGGSGGHLFPGLAVAEALRARGHEALLLVSEKAIDSVALEGEQTVSARALPGVGWPGLSPRLVKFAGGLMRSWARCREIFSEFKPDVVLGMGGFSSVVPVAYARQKQMGTLIHESNAFPGRVTRLLAPRVNKTLLGFASCARYLSGARCVVTGTPVRKGLARVDRKAAAEQWGLDPNHHILLIMGGSQGAHGLNELILKMLPLLNEKQRESWQFIHLSGAADASVVEINYRRQRLRAVVEPFSQSMGYFYSMADLVVARSGAASLSEISHYGLPSFLVPLPTAANDHQTHNARAFEREGAALVFEERKTEPRELVLQIENLLSDSQRKTRMGQAALKLAAEEAAEKVVEEIEKCSHR